jgi:polysaccharide biosynthesis transport protein
VDLRQYARALRANWLLIVAAFLVCTVAAGVIAWTRTPTYSADTEMFVATGGGPRDAGEAYQGGLFAQQRVLSYARVVSSPPVLQAVIEELSLSRSVEDLQQQISTSVPTGTVVIQVEVLDESPEQASAIANALTRHFSAFVPNLETRDAAEGAPVNVVVTSPARVPTAPVSPQKVVYLTLGALLGLMVGVGGAILREASDSRVRYADEVERIVGAPVLGAIVEDGAAGRRPLSLANDPHSARSEAYRRLRTNLRALSTDRRLGSFVVSSAVASEGKTVTVANLGIAFAQAGYRVVLVDADLRRPELTELMEMPSSLGLTNVLADDMPVGAALRTWREDLPLQVLGSGPQRANPSELLGSQRFATLIADLMRRADIVITDAPALLPVTDAAILAHATSGVLLVTRIGSTRADELEMAARALRAVDANILGVVLNRLRARGTSVYRSARYVRGPATQDKAATDLPAHGPHREATS